MFSNKYDKQLQQTNKTHKGKVIATNKKIQYVQYVIDQLC